MEKTPFPHFGTDALHAGQDPMQWKSQAVVPPISLSTTFVQHSPGEHTGYEYSRSGNPTRNCLEECIAKLENAKFGMVTASGLAATMCVVHMLKSGDHIVSMDDLYGGTNRYFRKIVSQFNIETTFVDCTVAENVQNAMKENTKLVWIETPTNPTMKLVDIEAVAKVVKQKPGCILVSDNTFMSAYFQRPLDLGADIVMHSVSKYMNGHTDVIMGALATNDPKIDEKLKFLQYAMGPVPSPFDCYLVNRGLKTLHVRMKEHMKNGLAVAKFLEEHKLVEKVLHPGLKSHPQYELGTRQMKGYSGMLVFYIKGGSEAVNKFMKAIKVFALAESLGGYESLAEVPSIMTHASVVKDERERLNIFDNMIRLSVGIEDEQDLIDDLAQALQASAV
ncbi:cystathionine gamma-lyase-like [Lineus longissimus]|uniref:cystathionine gamma-lyase-like n=1 Tax=Lineus longissimus TaxID=88925 RepID=UPI002B4E56B5